MTKKNKVFMYVGAMLIPTIIFFVMAWINGYVPFGEEMLNSYDSFTQYSGMLLEYSRLIRGGNILYSWGAGLGFNFLGTLTYYGMSPLNLFSLFASPLNYHMFFALMTYTRFALLGGSMCFYLSHKKVKPLYVVLFSTIYALMGYTATYYYNYIWIDSIIMLPLVIHGLDKLLDGKSPLFYIVSLTFTILINYYIGYMICIFSLLWFVYNFIITDIIDKKKIAGTFIMSSLLAGLMGAIVILPSFFALMTGKAELYNTVKYFGVSRNVFTFFYSMTTGAYQATDQSYGPALIYITIFGIVLTVFYFFNKKFTKKEKIATLSMIIFFYLSFSVNFLNYAWQLFQKPIWWQSRFSFTFSFFAITIAVKSLTHIDSVDFPWKKRVLLLTFGILAVLVGAYFKWQVLFNVEPYTLVYLGFSVLLMIEMFALMDKKDFLTMLIVFTFVELSLNTYNSLKNNYRLKSYKDYQYVKDEVPNILKKLSEDDDEFYRFELIDDYTSDDGLYFGYHGINYFNSVRNIKVNYLMEKLGITVYDKCHIELLELDPVTLSLLNIKYLYGEPQSYLKTKYPYLNENPYPLSLGFMGNSTIKDLTLEDDKPYENKTNILKSLAGEDRDLYKIYPIENFEFTKEDYVKKFTYTFTSTDDYLLMPEFEGTIFIDGEEKKMDGRYFSIEKGQEITVRYEIFDEYEEDEIFITLLNMENYKKYMTALSNNHLENIETNTSATTILEATIDSDGTYDYLFTSIEYERGMRVFIDDEEVTPDIILDALIGMPIEKGHHKIKITYVPRGLKLGSIISIASVGMTVFYLQRRKKVL